MNRSAIAVFALLLGMPMFAEDLYVPLAGGASSVTRLSIVNTSKAPATVTVEVLGGSHTASYDLESGESVEWSYDDAVAGAAKISSDARLQVTAILQGDAASRTLPILDARDAQDEGFVNARNDADWSDALFVVNTGDVSALVTLEERSFEVRARGTRFIDVDRAQSFRTTDGVLLFRHTSNARTGAAMFAPVTAASPTHKRRAVRFPAGTPPPPPEPETVILTPSKDNTLYEDGSGSLSNGIGIHLFTGTTASLALRRALLAFNVGAQIPPGSRIRSVSLAVQISMTISGPQPARLHAVLADWGEGASNAGPTRDGSGASARPGDATWLHRFFPDQMWTQSGGDFAPAADATVTDANGVITWPSSDPLIARVQAWVDQPATNFGWIIIGNEAGSGTAKRLNSREAAPEARPRLTVEFVRQ